MNADQAVAIANTLAACARAVAPWVDTYGAPIDIGYSEWDCWAKFAGIVVTHSISTAGHVDIQVHLRHIMFRYTAMLTVDINGGDLQCGPGDILECRRIITKRRAGHRYIKRADLADQFDAILTQLYLDINLADTDVGEA